VRFAPDPPPPRTGGADAHWLRLALYIACAVVALSTAWPWLRMQFSQVFADPGYRTRTGSICLLSCAMVAMLTMLDTGRSARETVRPGATFLAAVTAAMVAVDAWNGPDLVHGLPASWTQWFWLAFAGVAVATIVCLLRLPRRAPRRAPRRSGA
jgi:hypothetical protein